MGKSGVTLVSLVITIIIATIIAGVVVFNSTGIVWKSEVAKFGEDIKKIEDAYKEYYALNGIAPTIKDKEYTAEQVIALNTLGYGEKLRNEIQKNGDMNTVFYLINFDEIGLKIEERGLGLTQDDIYVVALGTNRVYYVKGLEVAEEVYFSVAYIAETTNIL